MPRPTEVQQQWQFALRLEKELQSKLKDKNPLFDEVEHLIDQLRIASENVLFLDFDYAAVAKVEAHLWDAHSVINNRYRKIVATFKAREMQKHIVEKRKWEKRYADFLKKSQYFYKGYIQRLASHFAGLVELRKIAHRLQLSTLTVEARIHVSGETGKRILLSCHATLLRLGDLSRYRNVIRSKDRSWEKALAYYGLANDLYPDSGNAFNQMAVISLSEGDHLNAIYHLYRALVVKEPNPIAHGNLTIEFKKIETEWETAGSRTAQPSRNQPGNAAGPLISWFVRLHAKLYKGHDFAAHDEMENEILGQLTVLLKEQSLEGILDRIVLINIAAEYFAAERVRVTPLPEHIQSYYGFLRLNIRTLFMLLQLLQTELGRSTESDDIPESPGKSSINMESITAVTRRILAAVRQYSIWLVNSAVIITAQDGNAPINIHIKELWSIYCSTLNIMVVTFAPEHLIEVEYLLEEDAETVGFIPLRDSTLCDPYTNESGLKPRTTDQGMERQHPNIEMLSRFRDLERDAMILGTSKRDNKKIAPITVIHGEFHFMEEGLALSGSADERSSQQSISPQSAVSYAPPHLKLAPAPSLTASDSHQSMGTEMYRMVDDLVAPGVVTKSKQSHLIGTDELSYGMHSSTAAEIFAPADTNGRPSSSHKSTPFRALPGIVTTPFSPQPGELDGSPIRPGTATRLPNLHFGNNHNNSESNSPNVGRPTRVSWGPQDTSSAQELARQELQQQLAQQYGTPLSSNFSGNSSSIYGGTPFIGGTHHRFPGRGNTGTHIPVNQNHSMHSTRYLGDSDFDRAAILQSSLWDGSQPQNLNRNIATPPGGQGG